MLLFEPAEEIGIPPLTAQTFLVQTLPHDSLESIELRFPTLERGIPRALHACSVDRKKNTRGYAFCKILSPVITLGTSEACPEDGPERATRRTSARDGSEPAGEGKYATVLRGASYAIKS